MIRSGSLFSKRNTCKNQSNGNDFTLRVLHLHLVCFYKMLGRTVSFGFCCLFSRRRSHWVTLANLDCFLLGNIFMAYPSLNSPYASDYSLLFLIVGASHITLQKMLLSTSKTIMVAAGCMYRHADVGI